MISAKFKNIILLFMLLLSLASVYISFNNGVLKSSGSQDFQWGPSKMLLEHVNPYQEYQKYKNKEIDNPFILWQFPNYPASSYVFIWPFASMEWENAKLSWWTSNLIFTFLIIFGLQYLYPIKDKKSLALLILILVAGTSWRSVMANGQHGLFTMALFIWALILSKKGSILPSILLAASWFKYTLTFPLTLYFIYKKQYKIVVYTIIIHILLTIFISFWIDQAILDFFFGPLQTAMTSTPIGDIDIFGIVKRYNLYNFIAYIFFGLIIFILLRLKNHITEQNSLLLLSILSLISLTVFYHLNYDFVLFLFPLWLIFHQTKIPNKIKFYTLSFTLLQWYLISISTLLIKKLDYSSLNFISDVFILLKIIFLYSLFYYLLKKMLVFNSSKDENYNAPKNQDNFFKDLIS